jgi:hypothetical protein
MSAELHKRIAAQDCTELHNGCTAVQSTNRELHKRGRTRKVLPCAASRADQPFGEPLTLLTLLTLLTPRVFL